MSSSLEVRSAIVTVLEGVLLAGVPYDLQVLKVRFGNPTPPCIDMWPGNAGTMHDDASAGFGAVAGTDLFTVRARVAASDNEAQQELLYSFCDDLDPLSVAAALMDDQTLGGTVASVKALGPSEPTIFQDVPGDPPLLGVVWRVEIVNDES